jgi:hypothetical protein
VAQVWRQHILSLLIDCATVQHIEPSSMSGVVNVTEVSMGWWDIPLEGHPMDTIDAIFLMAAAMLELLSLVAAFSLL